MRSSGRRWCCAIAAAALALTARAAAGAPPPNPLLEELHKRYPQPDLLDGFLVTAVLLFAMSAVSLIAWWNARHIPIFRTLALYLLTIAAVDLAEFGDRSWEWIGALAFCALNFELFAEALRIPKRPWIWLPRVLCVVVLVIGFTGNFSSSLVLWALRLTLYPDLFLIALGVLRGGQRERLIAIPLTITVMCYLVTLPEIGQYLHVPYGFLAFGWLWHWGDTAQILLGAAIFYFFIRELFRDQREKQRLANEVEAARVVQQVLIPEAIPTVSGFQTTAVYKPFSEVGGDFFQILPASRGGVLLAIGDVSGKGVPAAMTVALLVGTFRTLAHYTQSPGEILAAMNQRMMARSNGGFTTCLVVRVDPDGRSTAANAGHIAPLVNGEEPAMSNGLPLGLDASTVYPEFTFTLRPGERLTLMTDGVVEARRPSGELFGFERAAAISNQSAEAIASSAQSFGQEDDITVVALIFAATPSMA